MYINVDLLVQYALSILAMSVQQIVPENLYETQQKRKKSRLWILKK